VLDGLYAGVGEDEGGYEGGDGDADADGDGDGDGDEAEAEAEGAYVSESRCVMSQAAHCPPRGWNLIRR
jgi:hypothetical protein